MVSIHLELQDGNLGINHVQDMREAGSAAKSELEILEEVILSDVWRKDSDEVDVGCGELSAKLIGTEYFNLGMREFLFL